MKPGPQQLKQDVLIGTFKPPPTDLEVTGRHNGLLKDLIVLGYVPIAKAVIGDLGFIHQD